MEAEYLSQEAAMDTADLVMDQINELKQERDTAQDALAKMAEEYRALLGLKARIATHAAFENAIVLAWFGDYHPADVPALTRFAAFASALVAICEQAGVDPAEIGREA